MKRFAICANDNYIINGARIPVGAVYGRLTVPYHDDVTQEVYYFIDDFKPFLCAGKLNYYAHIYYNGFWHHCASTCQEPRFESMRTFVCDTIEKAIARGNLTRKVDRGPVRFDRGPARKRKRRTGVPELRTDTVTDYQCGKAYPFSDRRYYR